MKLVAEIALLFAILFAFGSGVYILHDAMFGEGRRLGVTFRGVLLSVLIFVLAAVWLLFFMETVR